MSVDLNRLFHPRSVAVVGATESPGKPGGAIMENMRDSATTVYPVHPTRESVFGRPAYRSVAELPQTPDVVAVAIDAAAAVSTVAQCAERGVPFVIVLAGGFGETGDEGRRLEDLLLSACRSAGTRILGPNTLGIQFPATGIDTVFVEHASMDSTGDGVAVISQSGSVGIEALRRAEPEGLDLRAFVGLGNEIDLEASDFVSHFGGDERTACLCLYVEHLENGRRLLENAREAAKQRPVILLKAGRTAAGAGAVSSHTGRIAGTDRAVAGALRQHGVQRVTDDEELRDIARVLSTAPLPTGNRVAVVTPAGGYGVMAIDYISEAHRTPLTAAKLSRHTEREISSLTLPFASAHNPVDLTAATDDKTYGQVLQRVLADESVDIVMPVVLFAPARISDGLVDVIADAAAGAGKPVVGFCLSGSDTDSHILRLHQRGIAAYPSLPRTVRAIRALVERRAIMEYLT